MLQAIHEAWKSTFCDFDPKFEAQIPSLIGMSPESIRPYYQKLQNLTYAELHALQMALQEDVNLSLIKNSPEHLFIGAGTVPLTPFVELLYCLLLDVQKLVCRISKAFRLEFYDYFLQKMPQSWLSKVEFVQWDSDDFIQAQGHFESVHSVTVHGSDQTINNLCRLFPRKLFLGYGHKISFVALRAPVELSLASALARDIFQFNQLGCLSPQIIFLIKGNQTENISFARHLSAELDELHWYYSPEVAFLKRSFTEKQIIQNQAKLIAEHVLHISSFNEGFVSTPGYGLIWLMEIDSVEQVKSLLSMPETQIACIAHNFTSSAELQSLASLFGRVRLCKPGQMQLPELLPWQEPTLIQRI